MFEYLMFLDQEVKMYITRSGVYNIYVYFKINMFLLIFRCNLRVICQGVDIFRCNLSVIQ